MELVHGLMKKTKELLFASLAGGLNKSSILIIKIKNENNRLSEMAVKNKCKKAEILKEKLV